MCVCVCVKRTLIMNIYVYSVIVVAKISDYRLNFFKVIVLFPVYMCVRIYVFMMNTMDWSLFRPFFF